MTGRYAINVHQVLFKYRTSLYPTCHCFLASSRYDMAWTVALGPTLTPEVTMFPSWAHQHQTQLNVFFAGTHFSFLFWAFMWSFALMKSRFFPPLLYVSICLYCENLITFLIKKTVFALIDEPLTLCKHIYTIIGVMSFLCLEKK